MRPLIPLFWTSGDVCPGFQSQGGSLACVILRFTSGATSADLLSLFDSCTCRSCIWGWEGELELFFHFQDSPLSAIHQSPLPLELFMGSNLYNKLPS